MRKSNLSHYDTNMIQISTVPKVPGRIVNLKIYQQFKVLMVSLVRLVHSCSPHHARTVVSQPIYYRCCDRTSLHTNTHSGVLGTPYTV